jgi:hypothetical protein
MPRLGAYLEWSPLSTTTLAGKYYTRRGLEHTLRSVITTLIGSTLACKYQTRPGLEYTLEWSPLSTTHVGSGLACNPSSTLVGSTLAHKYQTRQGEEHALEWTPS